MRFLEVNQRKIAENEKISGLLENWQSIFLYYQRLDNQPNLKWPKELQQMKYAHGVKFASFRFDSN